MIYGWGMFLLGVWASAVAIVSIYYFIKGEPNDRNR